MTGALACFQALALSLSGMVALSLAMDRHFEQFTTRFSLSSVMRICLRSAGALMLAASLLICLNAWGASVGFVAWWGFLTAGAALSILTLTYRPAWIATVGLASGIATALSGIGV